jgi:hypothetical protein
MASGIHESGGIGMDIKELIEKAHSNAVEKGFWEHYNAIDY